MLAGSVIAFGCVMTVHLTGALSPGEGTVARTPIASAEGLDGAVFLANPSPVTLGSILGGGLVALVYRLVYLRDDAVK